MASLRAATISLAVLLVFLVSTSALAANYTPQLVSPADGAASVPPDSSNFSWMSSDTPDYYEVEWSLADDFAAEQRIFLYSVSGTSYTCSGLPGMTEIFWRVVSVKGTVRYPSATRALTTASDKEGFTTTRLKYDDFSTWDTSFWSITGYSSMLTYDSNNKCIQGYYWSYSEVEAFLNCRINIPKGGAIVKFKWSHSNMYVSSYPNDAIYVQWSTDGTNYDTVLELKGNEFHSGQTSVSVPGPWADGEAVLPEESGGKNIYFRFRFYSGYGPNAYIDEVEFLSKRQDRNFSVMSPYGVPSPSGTTTHIAGDQLSASVDLTAFAPGDTAKRYRCSGWTGTGSVPVSGVGNTCDFLIFRTSTLTWHWEVEYRVIIMSTNDYGDPDPAGTQYFLKNSLQTFRIQPTHDTGSDTERYAFFNWNGTGACSGSGTQTSVQFEITGSGTLIWTFKRQFSMDVVSDYPSSGYSPAIGKSWHFENAIVLATCPDFVDLGDGVGRLYSGYSASTAVAPGQMRPVIVQVREALTFTWHWDTAYLLSTISQFGELGGTEPGWYLSGSLVSVSVSETQSTSEPLVRWRCTGWTSTGSLASGSGNATPTFSLFESTNIMWDWVREYYCAFSTNTGETMPQSGWFAANSIFDITAVAPLDTQSTRYFFENWTGFGRGSYTGTIPSGTITIREPLVHQAAWRIEHRLSIVRVNGELQTDPSGWYLEGAVVGMTALSPAESDGVRWRPEWDGTGDGSVTIAHAHNSPVTVAVTMRSPIVQRVEWFRQFSLTIDNPDGYGFCVPPVGVHWFFEGETAVGYAVQASGNKISNGYLATGSSTGASVPWFSMEITAKTTITWQWADRPAPGTNIWSSPATVAGDEVGRIQMIQIGNTPVVYFVNPVDGGLYRSSLVDTAWQTDRIYDNIGEVSDLSVSPEGSVVHIVYTRTTDGTMVYLTDGLSGKADMAPVQPPITSSRRARVTSASGAIWISWFNMSDASLNVAHLDGVTWSNSVIDSSEGAGFFNAIAIPPYMDYPVVAFARGGGAKGLYIAQFDGAFWTVQTVIAEFAGFFCDMALDSGGTPFISFQSMNSIDTTELHCAWFNGNGWVDDTIDGASPTGYDTSITIDNSGRPHIAYTNNTDLLYARLGEQNWETRKLVTGGVSGQTSIRVVNDIPAVAFRRDGKLSYVDASGKITTGDGGGGGVVPTTGGGGGCFVATAAFGTLGSEAVTQLTSYRDSALGSSVFSKALVELYYSVAPAVADDLSQGSTVRAFVRETLQ